MSRWFKMAENVFLDRRLQRLPAGLFRLWVNLQAVASWNGGRLPDLADVEFLLRTSPASLARRLDLLRQAGLIVDGEDGLQIVGGVDTAEHDRPTPLSPAERTRRWREGRRDRSNLLPQNGEQRDAAGDVAVTAVTPLEERREDTDSPRDARGACDDAFLKFWSVYPARDGDNPRQPAETAFRRAVAGGADPAALIGAARRYASAVAGRERRFVASAVRWLGEGRWMDGKLAQVAPVSSPSDAPGHWIAADTEAGRAWAAFWRATKGKTPPVDAKGGWRFPAPMPPVLEAAA